jgi:predicted GIY-YIG superfamily endonuclease
MSFQYVYLLESQQSGDHHYVGLTDDLKARLAKHNQGEVPHTSKFRPWALKVAVAFHSLPSDSQTSILARYFSRQSSGMVTSQTLRCTFFPGLLGG